MGFLQTLFGSGGSGRNADPTASWPPSTPDLPFPGIDLVNRRFGSLEFGKSDMQAAAFLGRPPGHKNRGVGVFRLNYPDRGFYIDFDGGVFDYVLTAVGPCGVPAVDDAWNAYCRPELWGIGREKDGRPLVLTGETTRADIEDYLGPENLVEADEDEDEIVLTYDYHGLRLEFEIALPQGTLYQFIVYNMED